MTLKTLCSVLVTLVSLTVTPVFCSNGELIEYCVTEAFEAVCPDKHVIVMGEAYYGRMRTGRCVKTDFGYLGCSADVLYLMDRKCSGRQECTITVPDTELELTRPCNDEFKSYLEASYTCMPVVSASQRMCEASTHLKVTSPNGYLSSLVTEKTDCGSDASPWVIDAKPGQRINFTLYDFNAPSSEDLVIKSAVCHLYAIIKEDAKEERIRICGRQSRERHVYTSVSGTVEVIVVNPHHDQRGHFLLKYQVYGCEDPLIANNMWITREDNIATVGCGSRSRTEGIWQMICQGDAWVGGVGNCTGATGAAAGRQSGVMATILKLPVEVALVIIVAVAFVVGILIFVIGFIIIRRRRTTKATRQRPRQAILMRKSEAQSPSIPPPTKYPSSAPTAASNENKYSGSNDTFSVNENEYAYVWDTPQPPGEHQENESLDKRRNHSDPGIHQYQCATHAHQAGTGTGVYEKRILSPEERRYFEGECPPQYFELDPTDPTRGHRGQHNNVPT